MTNEVFVVLFSKIIPRKPPFFLTRFFETRQSFVEPNTALELSGQASMLHVIYKSIIHTNVQMKIFSPGEKLRQNKPQTFSRIPGENHHDSLYTNTCF